MATVKRITAKRYTLTICSEHAIEAINRWCKATYTSDSVANNAQLVSNTISKR